MAGNAVRKEAKPPVRKHLQNDILHLLSPLQNLSPELVVYPDYTIETPIGFFKLAYSEKTHTSALFYSRHADNLAGTADDASEIAHKKFMYLIAMRQHYHGENAKWDTNDARQQLDMTWAQAAIHDVLYKLPRALQREATLHKISDLYISTFLGYEPSEEEDGKTSVRITTKAGEKYHFIDRKNKPPITGPFGWLTKKLSSDFNLAAKADPQSDAQVYSFAKNDVIEAVLADFHARLLQIWKGVDPVTWKEKSIVPMLTLSRIGDAVLSKAAEIQEGAKEDPEIFIRKALEYTAHILLGGPMALVEAEIIHHTSEIGELEKKGISPQWKAIGAQHFKRFPTITSNLHGILTQPDEAHFKDLKWLTPEKHMLNFAASAAQATPTRERLFNTWLKSQLLAPYASIFQYLGQDGATGPENTKLILASASTGTQIFYIPGEDDIYAYYNVPDNKISERKLNYDAEDFFNAGEVIKLSLSNPGKPFEKIAYEDFKRELRAKTGIENIPFPKAQEPPATLLSAAPEFSIARKADSPRHYLPVTGIAGSRFTEHVNRLAL